MPNTAISMLASQIFGIRINSCPVANLNILLIRIYVILLGRYIESCHRVSSHSLYFTYVPCIWQRSDPSVGNAGAGLFVGGPGWNNGGIGSPKHAPESLTRAPPACVYCAPVRGRFVSSAPRFSPEFGSGARRPEQPRDSQKTRGKCRWKVRDTRRRLPDTPQIIVFKKLSKKKNETGSGGTEKIQM